MGPFLKKREKKKTTAGSVQPCKPVIASTTLYYFFSWMQGSPLSGD